MSVGTRPLSVEEITQVKTALYNPRDRMLFTLGLKTGFRISELLSIEVKDLLEYGAMKDFVTVMKRHTKSKIASRRIPINAELKELLRVYISTLPAEQVFLFESERRTKLSRIQAWRVIKQAVNKVQLTGKTGTHSMRKTYAKNVYEKSSKDLVATQRCLGHKNINSTVSYLNFLTQNDLDAIILSTQD